MQRWYLPILREFSSGFSWLFDKLVSGVCYMASGLSGRSYPLGAPRASEYARVFGVLISVDTLPPAAKDGGLGVLLVGSTSWSSAIAGVIGHRPVN